MAHQMLQIHCHRQWVRNALRKEPLVRRMRQRDQNKFNAMPPRLLLALTAAVTDDSETAVEAVQDLNAECQQEQMTAPQREQERSRQRLRPRRLALDCRTPRPMARRMLTRHHRVNQTTRSKSFTGAAQR
mmetsp:Transcript_63252/g.184842  ORF Transcript_63252/g.184842 Transcript_63252/m.184842 type:complete len:130 (-) Transcript_63252:139-528(-)